MSEREKIIHNMWQKDLLAQALNIKIKQVLSDTVVLTMQVDDQHLNGHGTGHGAAFFALAGCAFAYAANGDNEIHVGQHCSISMINPVHKGEMLEARSRLVARKGKSAIYDVQVINESGLLIAEFRGHSRQLDGKHI